MKRRLTVFFALLVLALVFLFQRFSYAGFINGLLPSFVAVVEPNTVFIFNKTMRLVINDLACMGLVYGLFREKKYLTLSFYVFLIEVLVILPFYFYIKLTLEGDTELSSPLLSHIHRLIVNPLLMFLLILGLVFQRLKAEKV